MCINLHVQATYLNENQSIESKVDTIHADYMNVNKMSSLDRVQMGQEEKDHRSSMNQHVDEAGVEFSGQLNKNRNRDSSVLCLEPIRINEVDQTQNTVKRKRY